MNSHAPLVRDLLSAADNASVTAEELDAALDRFTRGLAPRCRLEVAAARVYVGPNDTGIPPLEALPLRPTPLARALGYLSDRPRVHAARVARPAAPALRSRLSVLPRLHRAAGEPAGCVSNAA